MEIYGATDQGLVRKQNQDTFRFLELGGDQFLAVVCDGMGGAKSGDVASKLAAEVFEEDIRLLAVAGDERDGVALVQKLHHVFNMLWLCAANETTVVEPFLIVT